jgi:predicted lipoprotein with Yx(FWY)xxD motif
MTIWQTLGKGRLLLIALTAVALAAAIACSSDDDDDSSAADSPADSAAAPTQAAETMDPLAVSVGDSDLGPYLTGADGKALYVFTRDMAGTSNCVDDCLQTWPPLLVEPGQAVEADSVAAGDFDSIETAAGLQVTYNGAPLYYFAADAAAGETNGHMVGNVWFLARPETASTAYVGVDESYLVGPTGFTLYLFANDTEGVSNCSGQCIENWPALTVPEGLDPTAVSGASGALGVLTRDDGAIQITYNGAPLYYYVGDSLPGDTNGDGVGGVWSLATP